jgi:hypothetical protein
LLDHELLLKHKCLFGGGTAIALAHGEYRESIGVDFVCSSVAGYRELRGLVHGAAGLGPLFRSPVVQAREPRVDQYGLRGALRVDDVPIKFEIIFEGRVGLADPLPADRLCGAWTLAMEDRVATKLMANSDRWADDGVMSRDLIDLAMLSDSPVLDAAGVAKALTAYGNSVLIDLDKARDRLVEREGRLATCIRTLQMTMTADSLRARIMALRTSEAPAQVTPKRRRK